MKLIEYIKNIYSIEGDLPKGSKKKFADSIGISVQQLTNMLSSGRFIVSKRAVWREGFDTIMVENDKYYVKTHVLPE